MPRVKSIKLSSICGAILAASIVCSTALAKSPTPSPTPAPTAFPTPTPNPNAKPPPGVQRGGVAIPVPVLNVAQYLPGGAKYGEDPDVVMIIKRIEDNFARALKQLEEADPGSSQFTQALGKALINDQSLSVNKNLACATCHADYSGFTGGSSFFNATTSALP